MFARALWEVVPFRKGGGGGRGVMARRLVLINLDKERKSIFQSLKGESSYAMK